MARRSPSELVASAADLAGCDDPLEAELAGALFVAMAVAGGDDAVPAFVQAFIPAIETRGCDAALMMLTAIGAAAGGVPVPAGAEELEQPVRAPVHLRGCMTPRGPCRVLVGGREGARRNSD